MFFLVAVYGKSITLQVLELAAATIPMSKHLPYMSPQIRGEVADSGPKTLSFSSLIFFLYFFINKHIITSPANIFTTKYAIIQYIIFPFPLLYEFFFFFLLHLQTIKTPSPRTHHAAQHHLNTPNATNTQY